MKYIVLKDIDVCDTTNFLSQTSIKKGEIVDIETVQIGGSMKEDGLQIYENILLYKNNRYMKAIGLNNTAAIYCLDKTYFIPLSQWRENRINEILE